MLRELPESEAGHNDYWRWFEEQRAEWEEEQKQEGGESDE